MNADLQEQAEDGPKAEISKAETLKNKNYESKKLKSN